MKHIEICLRNGQNFIWDISEYDNYNYDGKCLIINKNGMLVGIYPIDILLSFVYTDDEGSILAKGNIQSTNQSTNQCDMKSNIGF